MMMNVIKLKSGPVKTGPVGLSPTPMPIAFKMCEYLTVNRGTLQQTEVVPPDTRVPQETPRSCQRSSA